MTSGSGPSDRLECVREVGELGAGRSKRAGQDVHELTNAARVKHVGVDIADYMPKAAEALEVRVKPVKVQSRGIDVVVVGASWRQRWQAVRLSTVQTWIQDTGDEPTSSAVRSVLIGDLSGPQPATFSTPNGIRLRSSVRRSRCLEA